MPKTPTEELYESVKETANIVVKSISEEFRKVSGNTVEMSKKAADYAEEMAAAVAIKGKKLYKDWDVEKRSTGAALGAKAAILATWKVPILLKPAIIFGTVAGAIAGPKGVDRFTKWRDKHEQKQSEKLPSHENKTSEPN